MKQMIDGFLLALQFLTTTPLHKNITWDKERAKWSVRAFPAIGLSLGVLLVLQVFLLIHFSPFSLLIISLWIMFFGVLFTGGLHLDGWMDMSDAVFSYRDRERKLEIMSDSRVGAFGVISLLFLLTFRFLFIYEVLQLASSFTLILIGFIPVLSRAAVATLLITGNSAKSTGMAAAYSGLLSKNDLAFIYCFVIVLSAVAVIFDNRLLVPVFLLLGGCAFLCWFAKLFFKRQFGGITGDTLGALSEGEETFLWFVLWLLHSFAMV